VADFVPGVGPWRECGYGLVPWSRRKVERHVELDAPVNLTEKALDDLEAKACPRRLPRMAQKTSDHRKEANVRFFGFVRGHVTRVLALYVNKRPKVTIHR
jgi:nitric oxide reductase activation protein